MICPKCGKEMEPGFLQIDSRTSIAWSSGLMPFDMDFLKKDAITVSPKLKIGINAIPARICKDCKLLLGDYISKNSLRRT